MVRKRAKRADKEEREGEGEGEEGGEKEEGEQGSVGVVAMNDGVFGVEYEIPKSCYICKRPFTLPHFFYDSLCPECASLNYEKRGLSADLSGHIALLTGGRYG